MKYDFSPAWPISLPDSLWLLLLLTGPLLSGQNLVPNPGFEAYSLCPPYPGQVHLAPPWDSPNQKTTDYFHRCAQGEAGVPNNLLGTQEPFRGDAYLGLRAWIPVIPGNPAYREYATAPLLQPLEAGQRYAVSFWLSMAEHSSHRSDGLGLWFTTEYPEADSVYFSSPDVRHPSGQIIRSVEEWVPVRGIYEARGGERYLTIGNFLPDVKMIREIVHLEKQPTVYYYLDEVLVEPCDNSPKNKQIDTILCAGEQLLLSADTNAWNVRWDNGSKFHQRLISSPGIYTLNLDYGCQQQEWRFEVTAQNCRCLISQQNTSGLESSWVFPAFLHHFHIRVFDVTGRLLGAFGQHDFLSFSSTLPRGLYFFQAELQCGTTNQLISQSGQFVILKS